MNKHRQKCEHLKEIRKSMADALGVELDQTVCTYEGDCKGTCPKCRKEEQKLSRALLAGTAVAASAAIMFTGCADRQPMELEGDVVLDYEYDTKNQPSNVDLEISGLIEEPLEGDVEYIGEE